MPNHYTTFAICSPGYNFDSEKWNENNKEVDLCQKVMPMPEELEGIYTGSATNPDGKRITNWRQEGEKNIEVNEADLISKYGYANGLDWARGNWGTKWGTYKQNAASVSTGDGSPVIIAFQTAWNHPSEECLQKIAKFLSDENKFSKVAFVGFDPYDDKTKMISEFEFQIPEEEDESPSLSTPAGGVAR